MKTLHYITVPNPLKERGSAIYDYIGQFVTNGSVTLDDFCEIVAKGRPNIDAALVKLVLQTSFAVIADGIADDNVRFNIGGISFESAISGSVPSVDAALTAENELYVLISVGDPIRSDMATLTATNTDASAVNVSIVSVEDAATNITGLIRGTERAVVSGRNLSATRDGESITLVDADTFEVKSTGTVSGSDGIGQRLDVNFAAPFDAGSYWLVLTTRGYSTPDAAVATYRKAVTATAAVLTPALTSVQQGNRAAGVAFFGQGAANAITITGVIPGGRQAADALRLDCLNADGTVLTTMDATSYITASTATTFTLGNGLDNNSTKPDGDWDGKTAKFVLVRDSVEYPVTCTFQAA